MQKTAKTVSIANRADRRRYAKNNKCAVPKGLQKPFIKGDKK